LSENQEISGEEVYQAAAEESVDLNFQEEQKRTVPLDALESERAKRQRLEEENLLMRENLELLKANKDRNISKHHEQDELEGLEDDDILTVKQFKKLSEKMSSQFKTTLNELQVAQKYPDYQETITKYLPEIIKSNPSLRETLQRTQDYELAYYLAKNSEGYRNSQHTQKKNADAERILKNSEQSSGLSSVGASTPVSQAKRYKDMSDDEFVRLMQRNRM
jgi:hypothetical protein